MEAGVAREHQAGLVPHRDHRRVAAAGRDEGVGLTAVGVADHHRRRGVPHADAREVEVAGVAQDAVGRPAAPHDRGRARRLRGGQADGARRRRERAQPDPRGEPDGVLEQIHDREVARPGRRMTERGEEGPAARHQRTGPGGLEARQPDLGGAADHRAARPRSAAGASPARRSAGIRR
jgi:hypothetical protein